MSSPVAVELAAALCIALGGALGAGLPSAAIGRRAATALHAIGAVAALAGLALFARDGNEQVLVLGQLPVGRLAFALDGLSALFVVPIVVVSALGSVYGCSSWRDAEARGGRRLRLWWGVMTASMLGVVLARDAIAFLIAWEAMALAAFFLIATEEDRAEVRRAAWVYLTATHAGTLCLVGFFALLGHAHASTALWSSLPSTASWLAGAAFAFGLAGFGLKAGLVPLHLWLPDAHANAPSHVSALLSGVLLKMGVYGVVRVCGLLPDPPLWWGAVLIGLGTASGVLGIVFAVAQQDLKRLLAYSSIENVGIVVIGVGLATVGRAAGRADLVALGLGAALLHALNHSLFKPLLFLAAGNVLHATGTRRLSALGGLAAAMPRSFALFVVGAVAICGLPPLNGFASEFVLYVGLLRVAAADPTQEWVWASLAAPALAMIGALAVAAFTKVAGVAFAGAPRTQAAAHAHDPGLGMLGPMLALAGGCLLLGVAPRVATPLLHGAVVAWDPALASDATSLAALAPLDWVSATSLALIAALAALATLLRLRRRVRAGVPTWDCGYARPEARMQYVAASFSEILVGLFHWLIRSRRRVPELRDSFPAPARFEIEIPDVTLDRVVVPLAGAADRRLARLRALQAGPVQMYLLYVLAAVVSVLVVTR
jgi:hydrogenase-4 component B